MAKIIFLEDFLRERKGWIKKSAVIVSILIFIIMVLSIHSYGLYSNIEFRRAESEHLSIMSAELALKESIYEVLRHKGVSIGQGLDIANAIINKSREKEIPAEKILGIMKTESNMTVHATSKVGAIGLMQILPATWDTYVKKLRLDVSRQAAYDPYVNIIVAVEILSDLRNMYKGKVPDNKIWDNVLAAYFAGPTSASRGITGDKKKYVDKVNKNSLAYRQRINRGM